MSSMVQKAQTPIFFTVLFPAVTKNCYVGPYFGVTYSYCFFIVTDFINGRLSAFVVHTRKWDLYLTINA